MSATSMTAPMSIKATAIQMEALMTVIFRGQAPPFRRG